MSDTTNTEKGRVVQAWMSRELLAEIDAAAETLGWSRSQLIVRASRAYLEKLRERERRGNAHSPTRQLPAP